MKTCYKCKRSLRIESFNKDSSRKDGLQPSCRECQKKHYKKNKSKYSANHRKWKARNSKRFSEIQRKSVVSRRYNLSWKEYEDMKLEQNNRCAICKNPETQKRNGSICELSVDHCHKTGKVRALLCMKCNRAIGYAKEDEEILQTMIKYLRKFK